MTNRRAMADAGSDTGAFFAPYRFNAERVYVTYRVPRRRLEAAVAPPYRPRPILGQHLVVLELSHFSDVRGSEQSPPIPPYDEVILWTPAWLSRARTYYMFRLWLNHPLPIQLGREIYGFPKYPAKIRFRRDPDSLALTADSETDGTVVDVVLARRSLLRHLPLRDQLFGALARLTCRRSHLAFIHPDERSVTTARLFDVSLRGAEVLRLRRASIPRWQSDGVLRDTEARSPLLAVYFEHFGISLDRAQTRPAREGR